jgi:arabinofuranosyltransferase
LARFSCCKKKMKATFQKIITECKKLVNPEDKKLTNYILIVLNIVLLLRIISYAWVTDDAFITFRSVINFVQGYGPIYNIGERVQSFTHPLWFFLLSFGGLMKINLYYWAITLGIILSCGLLWIFYKIYKKTNNASSYVVILVALIFSESFLSFQTSGLENSLINILIGLFLYLYTFSDLEDTRYFSLFLFIGSLVLLNRLDNIVIIILPLIHVFFAKKDKFIKKLKVGIISFIPIISWVCFSIIYYGFVFPNTKYVKAGGRAMIDNLIQGSRYILEYINTEIPIIILLLIIIFMLIKSNLNPKFKILLASICLQVLYILYVGGDFMRGRFLVVVSIMIVFIFLNINLAKRFNINYRYFIFSTIIFSIISVSTYMLAFKEVHIIKFPGMSNERNFYKEYLALNLDPYQNYNNHPWAIAGQKINKDSIGNKIVIIGVNGLRSYFCGRNITLIDPVGLTDAFISRLPIINSSRTGHFIKDIPDEYYKERINNSEIEVWSNKTYKELNKNINVIVRSEKLFSTERFKSMLWVWKRYGI